MKQCNNVDTCTATLHKAIIQGSPTHNVAIKTPFIPDDCVLEETIGTARDPVHCIVTAHDALGSSLRHTGVKGRKVGLPDREEASPATNTLGND